MKLEARDRNGRLSLKPTVSTAIITFPVCVSLTVAPIPQIIPVRSTGRRRCDIKWQAGSRQRVLFPLPCPVDRQDTVAVSLSFYNIVRPSGSVPRQLDGK